MVRVFVRSNVADYETWREKYDEFYGERVGVEGEPQIWFTTESWRPAPSFAPSL